MPINYVSIMEARLDATLRRIDADLNEISRTAVSSMVAPVPNIAQFDESNLKSKDHRFNCWPPLVDPDFRS